MGHSQNLSWPIGVAESSDGAVGGAGAALETQHDFLSAWDLADFILEFGVHFGDFEYYSLSCLFFLFFFIF